MKYSAGDNIIIKKLDKAVEEYFKISGDRNLLADREIGAAGSIVRAYSSLAGIKDGSIYHIRVCNGTQPITFVTEDEIVYLAVKNEAANFDIESSTAEQIEQRLKELEDEWGDILASLLKLAIQKDIIHKVILEYPDKLRAEHISYNVSGVEKISDKIFLEKLESMESDIEGKIVNTTVLEKSVKEEIKELTTLKDERQGGEKLFAWLDNKTV